MSNRPGPRFLALSSAFFLSAVVGMAAQSDRVRITEHADHLRVEVDGALFTQYFFKDVPRPYCYPVIGPGEKAMTRNWPMKEVPDEDRDHKHHRSLWFTHGDVNGHDFWSEDRNFGKVIHERFAQVRSGERFGLIHSLNRWVAADGTLICRGEQVLRIHAPAKPDQRLLDFTVTFHALPEKELVLGDTKEGSMAIRIAETMRLKGKVGKGRIVNSVGERDGQTWGRRAAWCDYYGPVDGSIVGVAIFDHPTNPRYPTWWHVRDYGLFAANPFGQHDFEKLSDKTAGNLRVPPGGSVTFRYRFYFHAGDEIQGRVADQYDAFIKEPLNP